MARRARHVADIHARRGGHGAARAHLGPALGAALADRADAVLRAHPRALAAGERAAHAHPAASPRRRGVRPRARRAIAAAGPRTCRPAPPPAGPPPAGPPPPPPPPPGR